MSDLGAIFHVKKNGTQYDAHAYTTLAECPYPNLKIKTKSGTQAYVKLTTNGQGDVPFRVKPKSESTTYQVQKEAIIIESGEVSKTATTFSFTVPENVKRLKITIMFSCKKNKSSFSSDIVTSSVKSINYVSIDPETWKKMTLSISSVLDESYKSNSSRTSSQKSIYVYLTNNDTSKKVTVYRLTSFGIKDANYNITAYLERTSTPTYIVQWSQSINNGGT